MTPANNSVKAVKNSCSGKQVLLEKFFAAVKGPAFAVTFWNGGRRLYGTGNPQFEVVFRNEPGLLDLVESPSLFFGEAYMRGDIDISGSYPAMAEAISGFPRIPGQALKDRILSKALAGFNSAVRPLPKQKKDIAAHYDIGNDFFSLWLDPATLSYSCAYYRDEADNLETAQRQKLDLVLRKLRLKPGMRILDIGCGWGGLPLRAAREYGARVLAITLSEEQAAAARQRFGEHGLSGDCEARLCNYLELDSVEQFDRVVSVGMFEHVGKEHYKDYFGKVHDLLKDKGISLLHTLTKNTPSETDPWIARRIFPGGRIPTITEIMSQLSGFGFHLLHAESLRRHYVRTLGAWHENFSRPEALASVRSTFDQAFVRMWALYLRMSSASLATGGLDVHQFVFSKGLNDDLPMTLEDVYAQ